MPLGGQNMTGFMQKMGKILLGRFVFWPGRAVIAATKTETAVFAGGCFWCMTAPFEKLKGVLKVTSGYADGNGESPTYADYAEKGYTEGVQVTYDPALISYSELLEVFWRQINP